MKTIKKLTNEYASNLNCLFINVNSSVNDYFDVFKYIFKDCLLIKLDNTKSHTYFPYIDIVFFNVNDDCDCTSKNEMKDLIQTTRKYNELLPVYILNKSNKNESLARLVQNCYLPDGIVPAPFDIDNLYLFLYRVLKRIVIHKDLHYYIENLENEVQDLVLGNLFTRKNSNNHSSEEVVESAFNDIQDDRKKDLRFSQNNKISAEDFIQTLDDSIIDKIEELSENFDNFVEIMYEFNDTSDAKIAYDMIPKIKNIINECYIIIDFLSVFSITARAFLSLNDFLDNLTQDNLNDLERKSLLSIMLLDIINDLEKWIKVIFIDKSTEDIHYLDASFSSNVLEIENIFKDDEKNEEDDLEFF